MARRNKSDEAGASIELLKPEFDALFKKFPKVMAPYKDAWIYKRDPKDTVVISARHMTLPVLKALFAHLKEKGSQMGDRWLMGQVGAHIKALETAGEAKVEQLRALETAIIAWLTKGALRAWVFVEHEKRVQAMQVDNVVYHPRVVMKEYTAPAYVRMGMRWWERGHEQSHSFTWHQADGTGKTVTELLRERGCFKETPELLARYDEEEKTFLDWRQQMGEQFVGAGEFTQTDDEDGTRHVNRRRASDAEMRGTRLIVDDSCVAIENFKAPGIFFAAGVETSEDFDEGVAEEAMNERGEDMDAADRYARMPIAMFVYCFNLNSYNRGWVHINSIKPYVYRPELREKLILSEEHGELIDTLTADMEVLMEDIVSGKSGGTAILCQGKAGTGKTLTAEVYSEVIRRPLYRVHSGQLGTDSGSVENALKEALENASRWRAVLLIDEADVFISARGDDLEKNAVIGVFLRVLEYYSGLLFLTTNRIDTIDEAILSRCIAQIKYDLPGEKERERLWKTLGGVYGMELVTTDAMAKNLAKEFPTASGRDIKGLIKLVTKFSRQHDKKPTLADFKRMAAFRGM